MLCGADVGTCNHHRFVLEVDVVLLASEDIPLAGIPFVVDYHFFRFRLPVFEDLVEVDAFCPVLGNAGSLLFAPVLKTRVTL